MTREPILAEERRSAAICEGWWRGVVARSDSEPGWRSPERGLRCYGPAADGVGPSGVKHAVENRDESFSRFLQSEHDRIAWRELIAKGAN